MAKSSQPLKIEAGRKRRKCMNGYIISHIHTHAKHTCYIEEKLTKKDAKCSDVITALNPTTGTNEANNVPKTTCNRKVII